MNDKIIPAKIPVPASKGPASPSSGPVGKAPGSTPTGFGGGVKNPKV